jgi:hypothetical protein
VGAAVQVRCRDPVEQSGCGLWLYPVPRVSITSTALACPILSARPVWSLTAHWTLIAERAAALRRDGSIAWEHVCHEEGAAFAAAAEAALTGELAVCAGSCGPANLHLISGLSGANRRRVPVLAIAAHIPEEEIGSTYFQETHPQDLFRECSVYCELVGEPEQMPRVLEIAMRTALERGGVGVVVIPGNIFFADAPSGSTAVAIRKTPSVIRPRRRPAGGRGRSAERRAPGHDAGRCRLRGRARPAHRDRGRAAPSSNAPRSAWSLPTVRENSLSLTTSRTSATPPARRETEPPLRSLSSHPPPEPGTQARPRGTLTSAPSEAWSA